MPRIELSSSVYQRLLRKATSFDDTPEDVIGRLLDETGAGDPDTNSSALLRNQAPAPPGSILPVGAYWLPILGILAEAGGSAAANDVIDALAERMGDELKDRDRETLRNGEVRWRNRARFARLRMKERGLLSKTSPRGVWEITDLGATYLRLNRQS
ncbi:MAG TPA: winged helix-turn-helix domain-containing protein [Solirubrobacterales bacterium]|nr:winged helix-turn-helix domain-containing protein [Solirubrobacterales bacterium]